MGDLEGPLTGTLEMLERGMSMRHVDEVGRRMAANAAAGAVRFVEQERGPGLGASMAGACLGVSPYLSPIGAWLKLKGRATDTSGPAAEWGQILEPVIRGYYAARHGYVGTEGYVHVPPASLHHADLPWLRATPDGVVRDRNGADLHLVQVKTVDQRIRWHWGLNPRIPSAPPHYRVQAVVEMAVANLDRCDFAVLCGGNEYFEVIVERDRELEAAVIERLSAFWASLQRNEPPEIDDADEWRAYFADRLPKEKVQVVAPSRVESLLGEWKEALDAKEAAEKSERLAKNLIMAAAAEDGATVYETTHGRVSVVQPKGKDPYIKAPTSWSAKEIP